MNCRVVLVRPQIAANVGATARVMRNMGLNDLVLVAPVADPLGQEARRLSTHGEEILHRCRIVDTFSDAVNDCVLVVGTSARVGGLMRRQSVGTPEEIMDHVVSAMAAGPAALVFGPEPSGLTNAEVTRCHFLIHVPTDSTYPTLNLAQAVAICLYELRCHYLRQTVALEEKRRALFADQERMFEQLREGLTEIHFLYGEKADALMHALRHLLGRAGLTPMEVELLFGLARQLRWVVKHQGSRPDKALPD